MASAISLGVKNALRAVSEMLVELNDKLVNEAESYDRKLSQFHDEVRSSKVHLTDPGHNDTVRVNVGGREIMLKRHLLVAHSNELKVFTLLSGKYDCLLPKDKKGNLFIDLDISLVESQFNWLRDMAMWNGDEASMPVLSSKISGELNRVGAECLNELFSSFHGSEVSQFHESEILAGLSLDTDATFLDLMAKSGNFKSSEGKVLSSKLLYRGSRDGFRATDCQTKLNGKDNTICIVLDTCGNVFGGFADAAWKVNSSVSVSTKSFLFLLASTNKTTNRILPVVIGRKEAPSNGTVTISMASFCCFSFGDWTNNPGQECDLMVSDRCNETASSKCCHVGLYDKVERGSCTLATLVSTDYYQAEELEVYQIVISDDTDDVAPTATKNRKKRKLVPSVFVNERLPLNPEMSTVDVLTNSVYMQLQEQRSKLTEGNESLLNDLKTLLEELSFVAKFIGVQLPHPSDVSFDGTFDAMLHHCVENTQALYSAQVASSGVSVITINAGGLRVSTSANTLRQAPEGSPLANMASDAWGHDLDSDGNIYQDVNSELFVAIINHLRLKQLSSGTSIQVPPIVVYEQQKTALDNLLAFYMLTDLPVRVIA